MGWPYGKLNIFANKNMNKVCGLLSYRVRVNLN